MQRKPIIIGGGILILISLIIINFIPRNPQPKPDGPPMKGPQFRKDGELIFISRATNDTIQQIDIEIAETENAITTGLMHRQEMPIQAGMLFIFPRSELRSFWMKNTLIPLDIIYINEFQQIVTIQRNTIPLSEKSVPSNKPAKYVLEMNGGYCDQFGVKEGDFVDF